MLEVAPPVLPLDCFYLIYYSLSLSFLPKYTKINTQSNFLILFCLYFDFSDSLRKHS